MNAIDLLEQQHDIVTSALERVHQGGGSNGELKRIADQLVAHMVIEEHIFYPRVRELMKDMINESFEEHAVARFELARLLSANGNEKKTRALVLKELLEHHIDEEEDELFPKVRKSISPQELEALGARMKRAFDNACAKGLDAFFKPAPTARRSGRASGVGAMP